MIQIRKLSHYKRLYQNRKYISRQYAHITYYSPILCHNMSNNRCEFCDSMYQNSISNSNFVHKTNLKYHKKCLIKFSFYQKAYPELSFQDNGVKFSF